VDELLEDDEFWEEQARSLAVFASPTGLRTYRLPNRLTSSVEVADRFYVKPLLRAVTFPQAGFVLALASGSVRLVDVADASGAVTFSEDDDAVSYGVVDEIVRRVLLSGGRVFAVRAPDVPGGGPVAAVLRYAL
jgi:hypothetical protein